MPLRPRTAEAPREGIAPDPMPDGAGGICREIGRQAVLGLALLLQAPDASAQKAAPPREQVVLSDAAPTAKEKKEEKSLLPPRAERDPRLARLIKDLGHESFRVREKAGAALLPLIDLRNFWQLREALADDDAEIVGRSKILWEEFYAREQKILDPYFREVVRKSRPRHYVDHTWEQDWENFRVHMEQWKFRTLTETPRWIAHVSWMKRQLLYRAGLEEGELMRRSFHKAPNDKMWVHTNCKTHPDLDPEIQRLAGVYVTGAAP